MSRPARRTRPPLTDAEKAKIKELNGPPHRVPLNALAERFGVGTEQVARIVRDQPRGGRDRSQPGGATKRRT